MRGFVIDCRVRFDLNEDPGAIAPDQFRADEFTRAGERIALKKCTANELLLHERIRSLRKREVSAVADSKACGLIKYG